MPSNFFEVTILGDGEFLHKTDLFHCDPISLAPFFSKWNQFFNKIKFPFGRYIRIFVSSENYPLSIDEPIKELYWAINVGYTNYNVKAFFEMSHAEKKEALIKIMYDASKLVYAKYSLDFGEMEQCFEQLWGSDYTTYHKRVSKIYISPDKSRKVYLWHEIELGNTDIYIICDNKEKKERTKTLVYDGDGYSDSCFSYLAYNPVWLCEDVFSLSNETGEVIHIFKLLNQTFEVKYKPLPGWTESYLRLKFAYEIEKNEDERVRIKKELDLEFKIMQGQIWFSARGKY
jgi:hypothetical protein